MFFITITTHILYLKPLCTNSNVINSFFFICLKSAGYYYSSIQDIQKRLPSIGQPLPTVLLMLNIFTNKVVSIYLLPGSSSGFHCARMLARRIGVGIPPNFFQYTFSSSHCSNCFFIVCTIN